MELSCRRRFHQLAVHDTVDIGTPNQPKPLLLVQFVADPSEDERCWRPSNESYDISSGDGVVAGADEIPILGPKDPPVLVEGTDGLHNTQVLFEVVEQDGRVKFSSRIKGRVRSARLVDITRPPSGSILALYVAEMVRSISPTL